MSKNLGEIAALLKKYNQEQLLNGYEKLDEVKKKKLLEQIEAIDFNLINSLYESTKKEVKHQTDEITPIDYVDKYKFNELPQLFNVLKGDMSLVGPRPFIPGDILPKKPYKERYYVRPGMTGLAQINGGRYISHEKKLEYDVIYNDKISFLLDLKILILTPFRIIKYR